MHVNAREWVLHTHAAALLQNHQRNLQQQHTTYEGMNE
jgi:hypothetical protein